jgi:hypothetical protein
MDRVAARLSLVQNHGIVWRIGGEFDSAIDLALGRSDGKYWLL